jgi:hypothetical protein
MQQPPDAATTTSSSSSSSLRQRLRGLLQQQHAANTPAAQAAAAAAAAGLHSLQGIFKLDSQLQGRIDYAAAGGPLSSAELASAVVISHSLPGAPLPGVLADVARFLQENPSEVSSLLESVLRQQLAVLLVCSCWCSKACFHVCKA